MTLFTDNPLERMMIQRPCGRRDNAPPVFKSPACASCPYRGAIPLYRLLSETGTGETKRGAGTQKGGTLIDFSYR